MMKSLPYRQIHLDFHTSPLIGGVGAEFDADAFVKTLQDARVNSINLFARCHHGFSYYPTRVGRMHPGLAFDLFGRQLAAARRAGMRVMAYTPAAWSEDTCDLHPDWMQVSPEGVLGSKPPFEDGFGNLLCRGWRALCLNHAGYKDYMKREIREIYEMYRPDGIWIDIIHQYECICATCRAGMRAMGLDPACRADRVRYGRLMELRYMKEMFDFIRALDDALEVYFNASPAAFDRGDDAEASNNNKRRYMDFVDIESLPSEEWGYIHFPVLVNYINKYPEPFTMMNGKFHKAWGDFGSLRNKAALEYECLRALACGARVCVGDQLHPRGRLDPSAYERIGEIYGRIEALEPWCEGTEKVAQIGVIAPNLTLETESAALAQHGAGLTAEGVYRVLSELMLQFDFVVDGDAIDGYELLILPDKVSVSPRLEAELAAYLRQGGKLLCTGHSGLAEGGGRFALPGFSAPCEGDMPFDNPYMRVSGETFPGVPPMDYVLGFPGPRVKPGENARVLAWYVEPYFNRTYEHFCSHRQTPPEKLSDCAAIIEQGSVIYISPPLFGDYASGSAQVCKRVISECVDRLLPQRLVRGSLPSTAEVTLRRRGKELMLHILHYIAHRRCRSLDTIEDVIPLHNISMSVACDAEPKAVYLAPEKLPLAFTWEDGAARFTVPRIDGYCLVCMETR